MIRRLVTLASLGALGGLLAGSARDAVRTAVDARARGRFARTPLDMTGAGWKDIVRRTMREIIADRLTTEAAGVAFFCLMALVPGLSVLISLYGLFGNPGGITQHIVTLSGFMPDAAVELVVEQAQRLALKSDGALSFTLAVSLIIALWSANAGVKSLFDALNIIYEEEEKRSFFRLNAISLLTTASAATLLVAIVLLVTVAPALIARAPFQAATEAMLLLARWPVFLALATTGIAVLYWIGPSRRRARFVWVLPGAAVAAVLWALVSALFSHYASTFGSYQATYGSLSAVIVFMTWLWLSASVILIGAEFNSELEHQTARDTTEGADRPLGLRGAAMADRVGPSTGNPVL